VRGRTAQRFPVPVIQDLLHLAESLSVVVKHVAAFEVGERNIAALLWEKPEVLEGIGGSIERSGQVVLAFHDQHFEVFVLRHGGLQLRGGLGITGNSGAPVPGAVDALKIPDDVGNPGFVAELSLRVIVHGRVEGREHGSHGGIKEGLM
jgi:hypothetical protein